MEKIKEITICDECPCINSDYESGSSCNLDYDMELYWFRKSDNKVVADTPEMRSHQNDFDLRDASMSCRLVKITTQEEEIMPRRIKE